MKYSYTKVRKKTAFSKEMQLLSIFFSITLFMLFSTYGFLVFKDYMFEKDKKEAISLKTKLNKEI